MYSGVRWLILSTKWFRIPVANEPSFASETKNSLFTNGVAVIRNYSIACRIFIAKQVLMSLSPDLSTSHGAPARTS